MPITDTWSGRNPAESAVAAIEKGSAPVAQATDSTRNGRDGLVDIRYWSASNDPG